MRYSYDESSKKAQETTKLEKEVRNNTESMKAFQDMIAEKLLSMDEKLEEIKAENQMRARREPDASQTEARCEPDASQRSKEIVDEEDIEDSEKGSGPPKLTKLR